MHMPSKNHVHDCACMKWAISPATPPKESPTAAYREVDVVIAIHSAAQFLIIAFIDSVCQ